MGAESTMVRGMFCQTVAEAEGSGWSSARVMHLFFGSGAFFFLPQRPKMELSSVVGAAASAAFDGGGS